MKVQCNGFKLCKDICSHGEPHDREDHCSKTCSTSPDSRCVSIDSDEITTEFLHYEPTAKLRLLLYPDGSKELQQLWRNPRHPDKDKWRNIPEEIVIPE